MARALESSTASATRPCPDCNRTFPSHGFTLDAVLHKLRIRYVPLASERNQIIEHVLHARRHLPLYKSERRRLQDALLQLEKEEAVLEQYIAYQEGLLPSVRRLPPEVMARIFDECCRNEFVPKSTVSLTALRLSLVCHDWRVTMHSLPKLWARISVWLNRADKLAWTRVVQPLLLYLQQAGAQPLSIKFTCDQTADSVAHRLFRILASKATCPRIENLSICVPHSLLSDISLDEFGWSFPHLRHLNMDCYGYYEGGAFYPHTVRLRSVVLQRGAPPIESGEKITSVTRITLLESTLDEIATALLHFPNLEHATFKLTQKTTHNDSWSDDPVVCQRLTSLTLTIFNDAVLTELAENIELPQLNRLEFCFEDGCAKHVGAQLKAMAGIIKEAKIETFVLRNAWLSDVDFVNTVVSMGRSLRTLIVHEASPVHDTVPQAILTPLSLWRLSCYANNRSGSYCPNLRHLELVWGSDVDEDAVLTVLESRRESMRQCVALESALIGPRAGKDVAPETIHRLKALRKNGLQVSLI
ncbi:hypothetical protein EV421DRAFT_888736 [Armillaria borealis]|uniref:F-box domain-containing protein n=1 Tax=Armillaria borealis TaxID=47425 RepID=A0AA39K0J1_9AGAR|nr:hypothetical protein EV421DRAFT_888736 [Armillaria borealis]